LTSLVTRGRSAVLLALAAVTLAGCDSSSGPPPPQSPTPTTPSTTTAASAPAEVLRQLAREGAQASYRARYVARQKARPHRADWIVWHTPRDLRVDVATGKKFATLITTPRAAYACGKSRGDRTCFRIARREEPIPQVLRLEAQEVFSDGLAALAAHTADYRIGVAPASASPSKVAGLSCFSVRPGADAPRKGVSRGIYCFTGKGVLASVAYPSGSTVALTDVSMRPPKGTVFQPYASPTPLPR
jgi:hypothetical protein